MIIANRGGHTKSSCGAIGFINELTEDRKVIKRVNELLSPYHKIIDCTPPESSGYGEWNIGVNKCNSSNAEIFFSIHFNAGGGKGCECVKHSTDSKITPYANSVLGNLSKLGFTNRGVKNNDELAETRSIKCPSMIIEVCFVDTKSDVDLYNRIGVEKIARAIANGIDKRVSLNVEETKPKEEFKMENLVCYANSVDKRAAEYLADYLKCPCLDSSLPFNYNGVAKNIIAVGGGSFSSYTTKHITGKDRYETLKEVLKFIGK